MKLQKIVIDAPTLNHMAYIDVKIPDNSEIILLKLWHQGSRSQDQKNCELSKSWLCDLINALAKL